MNPYGSDGIRVTSEVLTLDEPANLVLQSSQMGFLLACFS